ncbi:MAG: peptidoglycan DD-metalloendopeptidase family protein, partial [Propionibacteriaceae bacterium]|nr:peptidoglycan DD-metalloendopeptidase family protein [Propionibacteriaceae bacterium]
SQRRLAASSGSLDHRRSTPRRAVRRFAAGLAVLALGLTVAVPAWADDLDDERDRVSQNLSAAQAQMEADSQSLAGATSALLQSRTDLETARTQLAETQQQLAQAQAEDEAAAGRLAQARDDLEAAKAAVAEGERNVAAQQTEVGNVVRTQYQQRTNMVGIGMVVTGTSTGDINNRVQWSTTVFDSTQAEMDKLKDIQVQLVAAKDKQAQIEQEMAAERARAAENLETRHRLAEAAGEQERAVANLVAVNAQAELRASRQLFATQAQAKALADEQSDVERRIAERVARQQAEEAERAEAERQAREAAARTEQAQREAEAARQQAAQAPAPAAAPKEEAPAPARNATSAAPSSPFIKPVAGPVTSRYGMRLHPVLKVWKLHDGTDYGAACNAPLKAAADGVVTERYYNAGYGNRLMIDHGRINGKYMTTGYNHATRYTVRVGQRVSQGQVIGYVGSTGYSTGCHLHLMTWVNGKVTNPQSVGF